MGHLNYCNNTQFKNNHVELTVEGSLKCRDTPAEKPLLHKDEYVLGRNCVCNYRASVGMLSYLQGYTQP